MDNSPRVVRQTILFSMALIIVPMVTFPEQFGLGLAKTSLIYTIFELAFYGVVLFAFNRGGKLLPLVQASAVCLVYRLLLGTLFGLVIAVMYSLTLRAALTLGLSGYLPTVLLHIIATPFVLRPISRQIIFGARLRRVDPPQPTLEAQRMATRPHVATTSPSQSPAAAPWLEPTSSRENRTHAHDGHAISPLGGNGFDRAARYIGEDGAVLMAAVVDAEGLLLGRFARGPIDPEEVAPFAWLLRQSNETPLKRIGWGATERVSLVATDRKLLVSFDPQFALMVVAERQMTDTLSIRINQAMDMVRQYIAERYRRHLFENVEKAYVRSA